jgi:hypothetical protein
MTHVSIPVANMLKNSWTLAVSVAINISMKLCFVSVKRPQGNLLCGWASYMICYFYLLLRAWSCAIIPVTNQNPVYGHAYTGQYCILFVMSLCIKVAVYLVNWWKYTYIFQFTFSPFHVVAISHSLKALSGSACSDEVRGN